MLCGWSKSSARESTTEVIPGTSKARHAVRVEETVIASRLISVSSASSKDAAEAATASRAVASASRCISLVRRIVEEGLGWFVVFIKGSAKVRRGFSRPAFGITS